MDRRFTWDRRGRAPWEGRLILRWRESPGASAEAPGDFALPRQPGTAREYLRRHPWVADAMIGSVYAVVAAVLAGVSATPPLQTPLWLSVPLLAAGLLVVVLRRRRPILTLGAATGLFVLSLLGGTGAELLLVVVALYTVGVYRSALTTWICFAATALVGVSMAAVLVARARSGSPLWEPTQPPVSADPFSDWLNAALLITVPFLIATLFGANAGERRRYVDALVARAQQLGRERDQQAEIAAALERERIAREMHDVIAHSLSVVIALSEGAYAAAEERPEESRDASLRAAETGRRALGEVRRLLGARGGDGDGSLAEYAPQPDISHLKELAAEFERAGLPVRLVIEGPAPVGSVLGLTVYRIVQESLTNTLRHARGADAVTVSITWRQNEVTILVEDDGSKAAAPQPVGRGILGMRERAALYGGALQAGPRAAGGWRVLATLPREGQ